MMPNDTQYADNVFIEEKLIKPFPNDVIKNFLLGRKWSDLLFHNFLVSQDKNLQNFKQDHFLKLDDEYYSYIPEHAADQYSKFKIIELIDEEQYKKLTIVMIEPAEGGALQASKLCFEYQVQGDEANLKVNFDFTAATKPAGIITKIVLQQFVKRFAAIAIDPEKQISMLKFISNLPYVRNEDKFYELPYGITAEILLDANCDLLKATANKSDFIQNMMPRIEFIDKNTDDSLLNKKFQMLINNLKIGSGAIQQEIQMEIVKAGDCIHVISNEGVHNLHQIGLSIEFEDSGNNKTKMKLGFHYTASNLVTAASYGLTATKSLLGIAKYAGFFQKKQVPEVDKICFFYGKNLFDTLARRVIENLSVSLDKNLFIQPEIINQNTCKK